MKKLAILMMCAMLLLGMATGAAAATITAVGAGQVRVIPDFATLDLGVNEMNMDVQVAQSAVNVRIEAIRQEVIAEGVAREDIAVSSLRLYANYDYGYDEGPEKLNGYNVSHELSITVRDLDKLGALIDAVIGAGANRFSGISFDKTDKGEAYKQAVALAVESAASHAETMATSAGLTLGTITELTEAVNGYAPVYAKASNQDAATGTTVDVGNMVVSASVTAVYEAQ